MYGVDDVPFLNTAGINSAALGLGGEVLTAEAVAGVALEPCRLDVACVVAAAGVLTVETIIFGFKATSSGDDAGIHGTTIGEKDTTADGGAVPLDSNGTCSLSILSKALSLASAFTISSLSSKSSSAALRAYFCLRIDLSPFSSTRQTRSLSLADKQELAFYDCVDPLLLALFSWPVP